jgi:hypothetical protein
LACRDGQFDGDVEALIRLLILECQAVGTAAIYDCIMKPRRVLWLSAIVVFALLCAQTPYREGRSVCPTLSEFAAESRGELAEGEQIFAYRVLADAVRRSVAASMRCAMLMQCSSRYWPLNRRS